MIVANGKLADLEIQSPARMDLRLYPNGIDARTGEPLLAPLDAEQIAALVRTELRVGPSSLPSPECVRGLPYGLDPADLATTGWAVVLPAGAAPARREALAALLARRAGVAGPRFKVLEVNPDERPRQWLGRHGVGQTDVEPDKVPYYLLFVGDPTEIPFEFQTTLSTRYCTGRLALDPCGLAAYAASLLRAEQTPPARRHSVAYWAPNHDPSTALSADQLARPLHHGVDGRGVTDTPPHERVGATSTLYLGPDASRARLLDLLHGRSERPALLLTASHGLGLPPDDPCQLADQGALLCNDWPGFRPPDRAAHVVGAADIADDADLHGLVAFLFACFGAGTPTFDSFPGDRSETPRRLAPRPLMSALPTRLLTHPRGGALAVVGHVDRAWGYSMYQPYIGPQILPFYNFIARVLDGEPIGHALRDFPERSAILGANLLDEIQDGEVPPKTLAKHWIERNDARNYFLLGDPAVRLLAPRTA